MADYATLAEFALYGGLPAAATASVDGSVVAGFISARSRYADGYVQKRKALPLVSWGLDLTMAVCQMVAFDVMSYRGFNPQSGSDQLIVKRYNDVVGEPQRRGWLDKVASGEIELVGVVDSSPDVEEQAPLVETGTPLGWDLPGDDDLDADDV